MCHFEMLLRGVTGICYFEHGDVTAGVTPEMSHGDVTSEMSHGDVPSRCHIEMLFRDVTGICHFEMVLRDFTG